MDNPGLFKTYDNGLRAYVEQIPDASASFIKLAVQAGATHDPANMSGRAHMFEHVVLQGTTQKSFKDIEALKRRSGVFIGATTAQTDTSFTCSINNTDFSNFAQAMDLLREIVTEGNLPEDRIEHERGVIVQELAERRDNPATRFYELCLTGMFAGSAHERSIGGDEDIVRRLSRTDLMDYKDRFYVPSNMILCCAAPHDPEKILRHVDRGFGALPALGLPAEDVDIRFNPGDFSHVLPGFLRQNFMSLHFPVQTGWAEPDFNCLDLTLDLLIEACGNFRDRTNLTYGIEGDSYLWRRQSFPGMVTRSLPETSGDLMDGICTLLKDFPATISQDRLDFVRNNAIANAGQQKNSPEAVCNRQKLAICYLGSPLPLSSYFNSLSTVTLQDVKQMAARIVNERPALTAMGPDLSRISYNHVLEKLGVR